MSEKQPFVVASAAHARHLLSLAVARLAKEQEAVVATQAKIEEYTNLAATLPEGAPASVSVQVPIGSVVDFAFGRDKKRTTLQGTIKVIKLNEKGQVSQYKVEVGSGFDVDYKTVFPGSITNVVSSPVTEDEPTAEAASVSEENDDPLAS